MVVRGREGDKFWATIFIIWFFSPESCGKFWVLLPKKNADWCLSVSSIKQLGEENKEDQRELGEFISVFHKNRGFKILFNSDLNQA